MASATEGYAESVRERTATYLDRVTDCTALLPDALDAYETDPPEFENAVERIAACESACDDALRDLRALLGESAPPNYTDVYLRADEVARLYAAIDAVPNRVERFGRELDAMNPTLSEDCRVAFHEMATLTHHATVELTDTTTAYVESLVTEGETASVAESVADISAAESECDRLKYESLASAFDSRPPADALVVRELVVTLDAAMDAVEDAGDQLLFMNSADM
ncbi:DUF47 domain-containing protein [Halorussus amylolyticus]|uniref:DUF47 domain-containing protein n=1 Tax=Halorussus amylolyticus TaxID=1126242 RepID=UPI001043E2FF|nr:DUF47 family protein [Halorussus amylolyticus]